MISIIDSRVWFVTGTSTGLGRTLVEGALAAGERVVATTRKASGLASLTAIHSLDKLLVVELDITSTEEIELAFQKVKEHFGRVDIVVNNAGYAISGEVEAISDEQASQQMDINFWGPVRITREAVRFFREDNPENIGGRILNISSAGGFSGNPTLAFYSASKFALEGFTESLAKELPPAWNVYVSIIQLGGLRTEWNKSGMTKTPPHPAYAGDTPTNQFRPLLNLNYGGDPVRAAQVLMDFSKVEDPPMRLQMGADSLHIVRTKCDNILQDAKKWEKMSVAMAADDSDPDIFSKIAVALQRI